MCDGCESIDRCAGCEALLQNLESQVTTANSRKDKESKIAFQIEQEVRHTAKYCIADIVLTTIMLQWLINCHVDKRGGGVAIVHRDTIAARPLDVGQPSEFEVLAARLTLHVSVVCIYSPPGDVSQLFCQQFADLLDQFVTTKQRFLICGDFYCPGSGDCQLDARLLSVPRIRTELARRAFSVAAPRTWNSLPSDIRSCRTVQTFKRHLKTHLFTRT